MSSSGSASSSRRSLDLNGDMSSGFYADSSEASLVRRRVKLDPYMSRSSPPTVPGVSRSVSKGRSGSMSARRAEDPHALSLNVSALGSVSEKVDHVSVPDVSLATKLGKAPPVVSSAAGAVKSTNEFDLPGRLFGSRRTSASMGSVVGTGGRLFGTTTAQAGSTLAASSSSVVPLRPPSYTPLTDVLGGCGALVESDAVNLGEFISPEMFFSDVLLMWMGLDKGRYISFNEAAHAYELVGCAGSESQRSAFRSFKELGSLARGMNAALQQGALESSFLQQSLRGALRRQLSQYMYFLASFREMQAEQMTLGDLVVAHQRVYPKVSAMHYVLRETESVKGGELVSKLQFLIQQGSSRLSSLLSDIYIETVSPLLFMVVCSITKGEVSDPFNEFFITVNNKIEDCADNFWTSRYSLCVSMLPTTIPLEVAEEILLVMKNVCFIRFCCRAKNWRMNASVAVEAGRATFSTLPRVVHSALSYSNIAVLRLLREEFKLDDVFRQVNAFLLVSYGNFYDILIGKLEPILSKLSQTIQVSFVHDQVNSALLEVAPYAKHLDTDRFFLLHSELIKDESKLGWDAFVLTMPLPAPLNSIFDLSATKVYRRLFRVLFRVKVAEISLKNAWRRSVVLDRIIGELHRASNGIGAWRNVAADAHLLGLQLNHFIQNLWSYFVSEVSTVAWDLLTKAINQCSSLDEVRVAHNAYLAYLTQRCLLHNECGYIRTNIENILTIVREYCGSQALLASLLERGAGEVNAIQQQYQTLADDFHREMSSLLSGLEEQHHRFNFLNYLLLRINFNSFYRDSSKADNTDF